MAPRTHALSPSPGLLFFFGTLAVASLVAACGSSSRSTFAGEEDAGGGEPTGEFAPTEPAPEVDPYANDPAPKWCGPKDGAKPPPTPTGTESCPSDKNKPGCACDDVGKKAACWTGLRANRGLGVCKDGVTTCRQLDENTKGWGPCEGQVLPTKGETQGKNACKCFSAGQWKLDNVVPCTLDYGNVSYIVSTVIDSTTGKPKCPEYTPGAPPPPPMPPSPWSGASLEVDCAGEYELCYEIKAGDVNKPLASDCSLTKVCQKAKYLTAGVEQTLGTLPAWVATDTACVAEWRAKGGYGEMTVKGLSVRCDAIDDGSGNPYMFLRVGYCPEKCSTNPALPECKTCQQGGNGQF
jgi:hypothetical protein